MFVVLAVLSLIFAGMCIDKIKLNAIVPVSPESAKKILSPQEKKIRNMVQDYPIREMAPFIARKNDKVAAYLVAIAKKESDWGRFSPKKDGQECYNYWGFRGIHNLTEDGYSCFSSPAQAVNIVGKRLGALIAKKIDTPREMVLWKCGNDHSSRRTASAAKWIQDVGMYYKQMM